MKLKPFELERYFSKYEFSVSHLLSNSDCEPYSLSDLLDTADSETKAMWSNLKLAYTQSQGNPTLLNEIAALYDGISPSEILQIIPEEGIYIAMRSLISEGDHVISMSPCYQSLEEIALAQGATLDRWSAEYHNGWKFDIDQLDKLCNKDTRMVIINIPHNPTGVLFSKEEFDRVIQIVKKNNCILFSDEMYRFLEFDATCRLPSACEVYERAISLCGLSKSFAMPGTRVGWLITQNDDYLDDFKTYKDYTTICASATSEVLAIIALRQKQSIIDRNLKIINKNLSHLEKFAQKYNEIIKYERPSAGSICMPVMIDSIDVDELAKELINEKSLMILPSSVYNIHVNAFRISFGRADFIENLDILDSHLEKYLKLDSRQIFAD